MHSRIIGLLIAAVGAASVAVPSAPAQGAPIPVYSLIPTPAPTPEFPFGCTSVLDSVSDNGGYISTSCALFRREGLVLVRGQGDLQRIVAGDKLIVLTYAKLDPVADTDSLTDVYSLPLAGGTATLMTPGFPGRNFVDMQANATGTKIAVADSSGTGNRPVFVTALNGSFVEMYPATATTSTNLLGMSDDGRYLLISKGQQCSSYLTCGSFALSREDLVAGTSQTLARGSNNLALVYQDAVLSGDGNCVVIRLADGIYRRHHPPRAHRHLRAAPRCACSTHAMQSATAVRNQRPAVL